MGFRVMVTQYLKKYPPLYHLAARVYYTMAPYHLLERLIGTRAQERRWVKRSVAEGYWADRNHPAKEFLAERLAAYSPISSILEVGSASGPNLYLLAKKLPQAELTGIDINAAAVKYGNRQFAREGITNVRLLVGKADELERFSDESFDIVFTSALLIYIGPDKIKKIIKEFLRISRTGLVLMECYCYEPAKDPNGTGLYYGGIWLRDYKALLRQFVPEQNIRVTKIPADVWPAEPWQSYGVVIEVTK